MVYETPDGKINASRFMRGADLDVVFDRFTEGREDATEICAVILLDRSGSMEGARANNAYKSMWAIKKALDAINAECTVITYNTDARVLYSADERASATVKDAGTDGGTDPLKASKYATRVLAESDKAIKIYFNITDGEWSDASTNDEEIKHLRDAGVLTALAFVNEQPVESINAHGCEITSHITNTADLFTLGRKIVKVAIDRNLSRA
jgi:Mg-chelatase subunit ChlD